MANLKKIMTCADALLKADTSFLYKLSVKDSGTTTVVTYNIDLPANASKLLGINYVADKNPQYIVLRSSQNLNQSYYLDVSNMSKQYIELFYIYNNVENDKIDIYRLGTLK